MLKGGWLFCPEAEERLGCHIPRLTGGWLFYSKAEGKLAVLFQG
jgi:hypothetical protein